MVVIPKRQASKVDQHKAWLVGGVSIAVVIVLVLVLYSPVRVALFGKAVGDTCATDNDCTAAPNMYCDTTTSTCQVIPWGASRAISEYGVTLFINPTGATGTLTIAETFSNNVGVNKYPAECSFTSSDTLTCTYDSAAGAGTISYSTYGVGDVTGTITGTNVGSITITTIFTVPITGETIIPSDMVCGNGFVEGEGCDDGNVADLDGCSSMCAVETGYICSGSPSSCSVVLTSEAGLCTDTIDNDADGLIDCADADCSTDAACAVTPEVLCADGIDNDGDGLKDCADSDCLTDAACAVTPEVLCADGIDNDGDTFIDCADPDCVGEAGGAGGELCEAIEATCNDLFDNDRDTQIDCADTDCTGNAACLGPVCTDGIIEPPEQCDFNPLTNTPLLGTATCITQGFSGGALGCYFGGTPNACTFDVSGCTGASVDTDGDGVNDFAADGTPLDLCSTGTAGMVDVNGCWYGDGDNSGCLTTIEYNDFKIDFRSGLLPLSLVTINYNDMKINFRSSIGGLAC